MFSIKSFKFARSGIWLLPVLLLMSCVSKPKSPVNNWVLGTPETSHMSGVILNIVPFVNYSEVATAMMYKTDDYKVEYDIYNRWARSPNMLLTLYLRRAFNVDEDCLSDEEGDGTITFTLSGSVTAFEADLKSGKVKLGIDYRLKYKGDVMFSQTAVYEQEFKERTPDAVVKAMSAAADDFVKSLTEELYNLKSEIIKKDN